MHERVREKIGPEVATDDSKQEALTHSNQPSTASLVAFRVPYQIPVVLTKT